MKSKSIWLGISLSLLVAVAKAGTEQVHYTEDGRQIVVRPEVDGSVTLLSSDGRVFKIPSRDLELIKSIDLNSLPKFENGKPCAYFNSQNDE